MSDFSEYSTPSKDWLSVEHLLPSPPEAGQTTEQIRDARNAAREEYARKVFAEQFQDQVVRQDTTIPARDGYALQGRTYRSTALASAPKGIMYPVFLYFHGGAFVFGTLDSEDATCARIAARVPVIVLSVNYRHAPEYIFPTPWDDAEDALHWLVDHAHSFSGDSRRIVVGGISAGGQLSASLTTGLFKQNHPARHNIVGLVLLIPGLLNHYQNYEHVLKQLAHPEKASRFENADAPLLNAKGARKFNDIFMGASEENQRHPRVSPGVASVDDVRGFPPTVFGIAGRDMFRDEALLYAKTLAEAG
jgi:acetyl esterase/lipase